MWEMQICGRGKTGQRVISPLHGPDRGNVKQGKTWGKQGGERQLRKKKGYIRSCDDSRSRHSNCRAMQEERYTSGVHLAKGYQSLMPYTDGNELSKPRDGMRGRNALHCALSRKKASRVQGCRQREKRMEVQRRPPGMREQLFTGSGRLRQERCEARLPASGGPAVRTCSG